VGGIVAKLTLSTCACQNPAGYACTPDGLGFLAAMRLNYRGSSHARAIREPASSKCMGALCMAIQECS